MTATVKCGYCSRDAIAWVEWQATRGLTKGTFVCENHAPGGPYVVIEFLHQKG